MNVHCLCRNSAVFCWKTIAKFLPQPGHRDAFKGLRADEIHGSNWGKTTLTLAVEEAAPQVTLADRYRLGVDHTAIKRHPIKTAGPAIRVLSLAPATPL